MIDTKACLREYRKAGFVWLASLFISILPEESSGSQMGIALALLNSFQTARIGKYCYLVATGQATTRKRVYFPICLLDLALYQQ